MTENKKRSPYDSVRESGSGGKNDFLGDFLVDFVGPELVGFAAKNLSGVVDSALDAFDGVLGNCLPQDGSGIFGQTPWAEDLDFLKDLGFAPASETFRHVDDFVVRMELPGVSKDSVTVELLEDKLVVSGEKFNSTANDLTFLQKSSEIKYGKFTRSFPLAHKVSAGDVKASFTDGVLTVTVAGAFKGAEGVKINIS